MNIRDTLGERKNTHGDFTVNSWVMQGLKRTLFDGLRVANENREIPYVLTDVEREGIEMICHKLGRIACGNPHHEDHWKDIIGYATLVIDRLPKEEPSK